MAGVLECVLRLHYMRRAGTISTQEIEWFSPRMLPWADHRKKSLRYSEDELRQAFTLQHDASG